MTSEEHATAWKASGDASSGTAKIEGEVDFSNSLDVRDWLKEFAAGFTGELRVDLTDLEYIDSSGLAVLIEIRKFLKAQDREIRVTGVSDQVNKLFTLTQIGELFGL
jgi:anti-sigma B factor antagonist